jgi:hypothetical protein
MTFFFLIQLAHESEDFVVHVRRTRLPPDLDPMVHAKKLEKEKISKLLGQTAA